MKRVKMIIVQYYFDKDSLLRLFSIIEDWWDPGVHTLHLIKPFGDYKLMQCGIL